MPRDKKRVDKSISIDRLFAEPFKPVWMVHNEEFVIESLRRATEDAINFNYRVNAYKTHRQILRSKNYTVMKMPTLTNRKISV